VAWEKIRGGPLRSQQPFKMKKKKTTKKRRTQTVGKTKREEGGRPFPKAPTKKKQKTEEIRRKQFGDGGGKNLRGGLTDRVRNGRHVVGTNTDNKI